MNIARYFLKRLPALLGLFLFFRQEASGQGWIKYFPQDSFYLGALETAADQGVYVAGEVSPPLSSSFRMLRKYDANGNLSWETNHNTDYINPIRLYRAAPNHVVGLFSKGKQTQFYRADENGVTLSEQTLGTVGTHYLGTRFCQLPAGRFLAATINQSALEVTCVDSAGQQVWHTLEDFGAGTSAGLPGLASNAAGATILVYNHANLGTGNKWFGLDANGEVQWAKTETEMNFNTLDGLIATSDGHFVCYGANSRLRKIDADGQTIWETAVPDSLRVVPYQALLAPAEDGGFYVAGNRLNPLLGGALILKFSGQGVFEQYVLIDLPLPGIEHIDLRAISTTAGGGFYLCGLLTDANFNGIYFVAKTDSLGRVYRQEINGRVFEDIDNNCLYETGERLLEGHKIRFRAPLGWFDAYALTNAQGQFSAPADTGWLQVVMASLNPYWSACQPDTLLFLTLADTASVDFPLQVNALCPFLETDIGTPFLRRCANNFYNVRYCNTGTADAGNAWVEVTLDPYMALYQSALPAIPLGGNAYRFDIGAVPTGHCGNFNLTVYLDCDSTVLGQTHCVEAHIFPDSFCLPVPGWSGGNVEVDGACEDSVRFVIRNTGTGPTGVLDYIVIEENIIYFQGTFQLPAQDSLEVAVPANGSTWRLEAEQETNAPGDPMPSASVEGCGENEQGGFSIGFVSQFGEDDGDPFKSIDCTASTGSYDPNDKTGYPLGVGPGHYIEPGQDLEYRIRFQNTGTDTAFLVVIRDTLPAWLDPASVTSGAGSHPYRFNLFGPGILEWTFDPIALPDSNVNEPASHGFVKFRVRQHPDVPLGTVLENRAGIYFDANPAVLTNTSVHRVQQNFLQSAAPEPAPVRNTLRVFPNPAGPGVTLFLPDGTVPNGRFLLSDPQGRERINVPFSGPQIPLPAGRLPDGVYFYQVFDGEKWLGRGKLAWMGN